MSEEKQDQELSDPTEKYLGKMDRIREFDRDERLNIQQRIHQVMLDVWYIKKEGNTGQYDTVEHDDVTRRVRPSLVKHGILCYPVDMEISETRIVTIQKYNRNTDENYDEIHFLSECKIWVRFQNIDNPDDYLDIPTYGLDKDKMPMTVSGKVMSYAIKYAVLKALQLETGEREDSATLAEEEMDLNAVYMYNDLGISLFGEEEWEKVGRKKIYTITGGKTSEASRAPVGAVTQAIKNLWQLKKKKEEEPDKDIKEIDEETDEKKNENSGNDILNDFK